MNDRGFGVTWDSGADPYAELAMTAPYAVTAQIKTRVASPDGSKPADLARIVRILEDVNYRGCLALEYSEPRTAVPRYLAELRRLTTCTPHAPGLSG